MKPTVLIFKDQVDMKHLMIHQTVTRLEAGHQYILILDSPFLLSEQTFSPLQPIIDVVFGDRSLRIVSSDELIIIPQLDVDLNQHDIMIKLSRRELFKDIYHIDYQDKHVTSLIEGHHSRYYSVKRIVVTYGVLIIWFIMFIILMTYILKRFV